MRAYPAYNAIMARQLPRILELHYTDQGAAIMGGFVPYKDRKPPGEDDIIGQALRRAEELQHDADEAFKQLNQEMGRA